MHCRLSTLELLWRGLQLRPLEQTVSTYHVRPIISLPTATLKLQTRKAIHCLLHPRTQPLLVLLPLRHLHPKIPLFHPLEEGASPLSLPSITSQPRPRFLLRLRSLSRLLETLPHHLLPLSQKLLPLLLLHLLR